MKKIFNIQLFAEEDLIKTGDIEPAISVDFTTGFTKNIKELRELLGIHNMTSMSSGTLIKIYKTVQENNPNQVEEGEVIPLTKITKKLARTIELKLNKYRKETTAENIQRAGRKSAVNDTDDFLLAGIRKGIKTTIFDTLADGQGAASGTTLQKALANAWGKLQKYYDDMDATPIYFISSEDVADYLGETVVTTQTVFGMSYIENFLGLGRTIISPNVAKGKVIATAREKLRCAYAPLGSGDVGSTFGLTADETGLIGMKHYIQEDCATIGTLIFTGVVFYPEFLDGVFVSKITGDDGNGDEGNGDEGDGDQGNP